jgi:transposase
MPAPYSYDLRKKAIEAVKRGQRKTDVCRFFKISRNSLDLWLKRSEKTGDIRSSIPQKKGATPKIKDAEKFRDFVAKNQDKTQGKWLKYGEIISLSKTLVMLVRSWALLAKKNLRLSRKK